MAIAEAELRSIVREVLSDALPKLQQSVETRQVSIANDDDLSAFVSQLLALVADKSTAARLTSGLLKFSLATAPAAAAPSAPAQASAPSAAAAPAVAAAAPSSVLRIEKGAVTERVIAQVAQSSSKLVLGARAVLTPLARESARKHGVVIERAA